MTADTPRMLQQQLGVLHWLLKRHKKHPHIDTVRRLKQESAEVERELAALGCHAS